MTAAITGCLFLTLGAWLLLQSTNEIASECITNPFLVITGFVVLLASYILMLHRDYQLGNGVLLLKNTKSQLIHFGAIVAVFLVVQGIAALISPPSLGTVITEFPFEVVETQSVCELGSVNFITAFSSMLLLATGGGFIAVSTTYTEANMHEVNFIRVSYSCTVVFIVSILGTGVGNAVLDAKVLQSVSLQLVAMSVIILISLFFPLVFRWKNAVNLEEKETDSLWNVKRLLGNPISREFFRRLVAMKYSEEHVNFWEDVYRYVKITKDLSVSDQECLETAGKIVNLYIRNGAEKEVNVSHVQKKNLLKTFEKSLENGERPSAKLFDVTMKEVEELLTQNFSNEFSTGNYSVQAQQTLNWSMKFTELDARLQEIVLIFLQKVKKPGDNPGEIAVAMNTREGSFSSSRKFITVNSQVATSVQTK